MNPTIKAQNLGPISELNLTLDAPGVTVLSAPNGSGKSILVDSVEQMTQGKSKLPLKRGEERGFLEAIGVRAAINPKATRTAGAFSVPTLDVKHSPSDVVDPGVSEAVAADKRRIRSLIAMSGIEPNAALFPQCSEEFVPDEFDHIVTVESRSAADIVDMANKIARDYQAEARGWEKMADLDETRGQSLRERLGSINLMAECDPDVLQERFITAQTNYSTLTSTKMQAGKYAEAAEKARAELQRWDERDLPTVAEATEAVSKAVENIDSLSESRRQLGEKIEALKLEFEDLGKQIKVATAEMKTIEQTKQLAENHAERRAACLKAIADCENFPCPTPDEIEDAKEIVGNAREAMEYGAKVREAKTEATQVKNFLDSAAARRSRAEHYRQAAAATDSVLCQLLQTDIFRVITVGQNKRLQAFHPTKKEWMFYADMSEAEKWTRALDEAINRVGEGGLIPLKQEAWEGMDVWNREIVHEHAKSRGVYVLAVEATRDKSDGREFVSKHFDEVNRETEDTVSGE
jgi:hypothetical protein